MKKFLICLAALVISINGQEADNICAGLPDNTLLNNEASCNSYFQCVGEVAEAGRCPGLLWFDPIALNCNFQEAVECSDAISCYPDGIEMHPHPYTCSQYIMCFSGTQVEMNCAPGFHWSIFDGVCTTQDLAECDIERSLCPEIDNPEELVFIPSSRDCEIYYLCYNHQTILLNCAPGKHFDPVMSWCDSPEIAQCEVNVGPEPEPEPDITEIKCPVSEDRVTWEPHPIVCEHFFICVDGVSYLQHCAPGLYFDTVNRYCTFPELALCVIPSPLFYY